MNRILIPIVAAAAAALAACGGSRTAADTQTDVRVLTRCAAAETDTVRLTEVFTSEIEPFRENDITPAASGVHIDRILVDVGDAVREGDLLVTLDPTQYTQQLVQLRTGYHYGERRDYYPSYWTVGAGLRILHLRLDFAYLFAKKHSLLRNTYSISFGLDF